MKITLTIPDELYEVYERHGKGDAPAAIKAQLDKFKDVPPAERTLTVWGNDRLALEKIIQTTVESPERLLAFLRNAGSVKIGHVERIFSPAEMIRINTQAQFHGRTPREYVEMTANEALDYLFDRI